jgi:hypothetical protein
MPISESRLCAETQCLIWRMRVKYKSPKLAAVALATTMARIAWKADGCGGELRREICSRGRRNLEISETREQLNRNRAAGAQNVQDHEQIV